MRISTWEHVLFTPGTRRSRAPCDRLTTTAYTMCVIGQTTRAYYRGTHICSPGARRSRAGCDRLLSQAYTGSVIGLILGHIVGGTRTLFTPGSTRRSRATFDRDTVTVHCAGQTTGACCHCRGTRTLFTPRHAAPEHPVTD